MLQAIVDEEDHGDEERHDSDDRDSGSGEEIAQGAGNTEVDLLAEEFAGEEFGDGGDVTPVAPVVMPEDLADLSDLRTDLLAAAARPPGPLAEVAVAEPPPLPPPLEAPQQQVMRELAPALPPIVPTVLPPAPPPAPPPEFSPFTLTRLQPSPEKPHPGWQIRCPFHAKNDHTGCKKSLRTWRPGDTEESILAGIKWWALQAAKFDRQRWHRYIDPRNEPVPSLAIVNEMYREQRMQNTFLFYLKKVFVIIFCFYLFLTKTFF